MNIKWYADESARAAHNHMERQLRDFVEASFPGHELSHSGFNRNNDTGEVIIKLHLNPIGKVKIGLAT